MRIHAITDYSYVNGPGLRSVIHFQGCKFQCPGCFNPETHSLSGGMELSLDEVLKKIPPNIDGVTISGGEPFLQQEALLELVKVFNELNYPIVVFSGFYRSEIERLKLGKAILSKIDVLIDGRFDAQRMAESGLHGSENQIIHILSSRYKEHDFHSREVEISFDLTGNTTVTGFPTKELLKGIK